MERRRGQIRCTESSSLQRDGQRFASDFGLRLDAVLVAAGQDQKASLGSTTVPRANGPGGLLDLRSFIAHAGEGRPWD